MKSRQAVIKLKCCLKESLNTISSIGLAEVPYVDRGQSSWLFTNKNIEDKRFKQDSKLLPWDRKS